MSMRKIALIGLLGLGLTACADKPSRVDWSSDCQTHHSYDSNELDACKKKVASGVTFDEIAGQVYVDPYNVDRVGHEHLGKGREPEA